MFNRILHILESRCSCVFLLTCGNSFLAQSCEEFPYRPRFTVYVMLYVALSLRQCAIPQMRKPEEMFHSCSFQWKGRELRLEKIFSHMVQQLSRNMCVAMGYSIDPRSHSRIFPSACHSRQLVHASIDQHYISNFVNFIVKGLIL